MLGGKTVKTNNGFICDTICHNHPGESHNKKLYFYSNSKLFRCYTECDSAFDIFELIIKAKAIQEEKILEFPQAVNLAIDFLQLSNFDFYSYSEKKDSEEIDLLKKQTSIFDVNTELNIIYDIYDNNIINNFSFVIPEPWLKEGITKETMERYQIKYHGTDHKIVIPHYNLFNELIGIRGRALSQDDVDNYGKYMPLRIGGKMYSHPLSKNLYGLEHNLLNITNMKKIVIFESEKSVLLYDSLFGKDNNISVAVCGSSISLHQIELIKQFCEVNEIVIAFDKQFKEIGDEEFSKHKKLLLNNANKIPNSYTVSIMFDKFNLLKYKDAPIDNGKEIFEFLYKNRIVLG